MSLGWEVTHGLCFFPGAGFSRCHHQCTQSTLSGPSLPVAQLGKWEPTGLAPIRPSTYSTAWEWGKGDVEITPKYPGPLRGAGALLPRTVAVPPTAPPRGLQPAQKGLGCGVLHLSPFPSSTCRLGWGKTTDFGKTLWVLTGGVGGGGCSAHWRHPGVPPPAPRSQLQPPTSFSQRARPDPSRSRSHPGVGAPRDFSLRGSPAPTWATLPTPATSPPWAERGRG